MATFSYIALKPSGERVEGTVNAATRAQAVQMLDRGRLQPISITAGDGGGSAAPAKERPERSRKNRQQTGNADAATTDQAPAGPENLLLTRKQIILFTEEVSDLLDAGLQLEQALKVMENRRELTKLADVVRALRQQVREGVNFSAALRSSSKSFGELYCNLVAAGEMSGSLSRIMRQQAKYLQTMSDLQSRMIQSMIYPSFIISAGIMLIAVFVLILVPRLEELFSKTGQTIPFLTQLLIDLSRFVGTYWWLLLGLFMLAALAFWQVLQLPQGRLWWDRVKLKIPLYGPVAEAHFFAQFAATLSNLVGNGIPLHKALQLVNQATSNKYVKTLLKRVTEAVGEGGLLSRSMARAGWFPPLLMDMVAVGEQTGDLPESLGKVSERYDKELNVKIARLTSLINPIIIIIMALVVGAVIYSILSGIFQAIQGMN
jgi:type II secretory pathway component PulF